MTTFPGPSNYLEAYLAPLAALLARDDITDLYVNRPGELWAETLGGAVEHHLVSTLDEALLWRLARQIASLTHQGISRGHPLLAATLPDGSRVQVVAPPATRGSIALAVRKHLVGEMKLADYLAQGAFKVTRGEDSADPVAAELDDLYAERNWSGFLAAAVRARQTILISGGTSTGKTTFLNALLSEVPATERLILIEDTPELRLRHTNAVGLVAVRGALGEARVTPEDLLAASLRMRPDRIILGELRGPEAFTWLRAVNTGHPGSLTTVHADNPERAVEQLALMVLQSGSQLRREEVTHYVRNVVDVYVQLERGAGLRRVAEVRRRIPS